MPPRRTGFAADVKSGDRRRGLEALRDKLAAEIDAGVAPKDLAALAGRLQSVLAELQKLGAGEGVSVADELAARRAARESADFADAAGDS